MAKHGAMPVNILWSGPLQSSQAMIRGTAPHPATMRWQHMFIRGLREAGHHVRWIGHEPHRTWPWGPLRVSAASQADIHEIDREGTQVCYTNVSRFRNRSLRSGYRRATLAAIRAARPDVVVTYNADPWMQGVADAATAESIPWVPMILECLNPLIDGWRNFRRDTNRAAAVAFISHWAFTHAPGDQKYLLSGAVASRPASPASRDKNRAPLILYAGAHSRAGGIDRLIAALPRLRTAGVRLVITGQGKGLDPDITRACDTTSGVQDLGMVPEARLAELASAADVLVNPRPIDFEDNRTNFPSKILDYLSYKRPIVSTRTDGIGPGYDELVHFTASDEPSDIAEAIDDVLQMDDHDLDRWMQRVAVAVDLMTPKRAAADFIEWLRCISIVPHSGTAT
jgi:glycosyltransferase involved in cell wall biosynthesis